MSSLSQISSILKQSILLAVLLWSVSCQSPPDNVPAQKQDLPDPGQKPDLSEGRSLDWDDRANGREWSKIMFAQISEYGRELIPATKDVTSFCPKYNKLDTINKIHFWAQLFAGISRFESAHDPTLRNMEPGADDVTLRQLWREGLLQISYQDQKLHGCSQLDWRADQAYEIKSLERSILKPNNNLLCGVKIMIDHLKKENRIVLATGAYWDSISSKSRELTKIISLTKALPFCK